jgi:hypothetical protein
MDVKILIGVAVALILCLIIMPEAYRLYFGLVVSGSVLAVSIYGLFKTKSEIKIGIPMMGFVASPILIVWLVARLAETVPTAGTILTIGSIILAGLFYLFSAAWIGRWGFLKLRA